MTGLAGDCFSSQMNAICGYFIWGTYFRDASPVQLSDILKARMAMLLLLDKLKLQLADVLKNQWLRLTFGGLLLNCFC